MENNEQRELLLQQCRDEASTGNVDYSLLEGLKESRKRTQEEIESLRPQPEPLDEEVESLLDRLWLVTRKSEDQLGDRKGELIAHWVEILSEKQSVDISKRALRYLIRTSVFFPAPVNFHQMYNAFDSDRNGY